MDITSESVCPQISDTKAVEEMLMKSYGLTVVSLKSLNGYDDLNFHVKVEDVYENNHIDHISPHGYLVKVVNYLDSKQPEFILGQTRAMEHLNSKGIKCQEEVKNVYGQLFSSINTETNGEVTTNVVSVRTFLPGVLLNDVTFTTTMAYEVGILTAKITKAFQDFHFPYHDSFTPLWNMDNLLKVKEVTNAVKDETRRKIAEEVIKKCETEVFPRRGEFRRGQIHGDLNEQNVLVETTPNAKICGVIDFQDTARSYVIYDICLAIAYMMMLTNSEVPVNDVGGHVLAGYESLMTLNTAERNALRTLVAGRMTMSLVYGAFYHSQNPSKDYVLTTSLAGWKSLLQFWQETEETVWKRWNEILQSYTI